MLLRLQTRFRTWFAAVFRLVPPEPPQPQASSEATSFAARGSTLRRAVSGWLGLGLLGAPQVHVDISFWLNCAESTLDQGVRIPALASSGCESCVPLGPLGDAWLGRVGKDRVAEIPRRGASDLFLSQSLENSPFVWNSQLLWLPGKRFWKLEWTETPISWVLTVAWKQADLFLKKAVSKVDPQGLQGDVFYLVASGRVQPSVCPRALPPHSSPSSFIFFSFLKRPCHFLMPLSLSLLCSHSLGRVGSGRSGEAGGNVETVLGLFYHYSFKSSLEEQS